MIRQFGAAAQGALEADLCIVGAGAAGLSLATQFVGSRWRVLVLESGRREPDGETQALNALECVGLRHDGWREGRIRALGGTTRSWGGQLVPMRSSEWEARSWVPGSGWPFPLEELQPYYRRIEQLLQIEGAPYDESVGPRLGLSLPAFDRRQFRMRFSQWASLGRRNFAVLWRRELERSANISVVLDATAVAVCCDPSGSRCEHIRIRSRSGQEARVRASLFVIACGGIETPRLLLGSPSPAGRGVANRSGLVGRFFQDHLSFLAGELQPLSRRTVQDAFDPRYVGSTMFSLKIEPTDAAMREQAWLNCMAHVAFEIPDALGWLELRKLLRSAQAGRLALPSLDEGLAMMRGSLELSRLVITRYLARRRRSPDRGRVLLRVDSEQVPNGASRITLDDTVDALGMRRARLDWRTCELERRTLLGFARSVAGELERLGLARVRLAAEPDFAVRDVLGSVRDIFHHMGTARMSTAARDGVTNAELRCHDVDNLFIAGPAVFPAGGIANPTFTALALSLRLADLLKRELAAADSPANLDPTPRPLVMNS